MFSIQNLDPGTRIELLDALPAVVAQNPRDGVWLLASVELPSPDGPERAAVDAAFVESAHGAVRYWDAARCALMLYVHADDITGLR